MDDDDGDDDDIYDRNTEEKKSHQRIRQEEPRRNTIKGGATEQRKINKISWIKRFGFKKGLGIHVCIYDK